jgi:DNA topoisomerase-1
MRRRDTRRRAPEPELITDPVEAAEAAGLRYVRDGEPGITRRRAGKHFRYIGPDGQPVQDEAELERIRKIGLPPAYTSVWICPDPNGHIQATGRDARGRKQYRYHPRWREVRDATKYGRMITFGRALPAIRERVERDLARPGLPREKVLAAVVRLLETTLIRVGNDEYARANQSFGLTTMRDRHVEISGSTMRFRFKGKSGKHHSISITDPRLARIVRRCKEIPGYDLFQYIDDQGQRQDVRSEDINTYLREISGENFTAKDFRTWAGTVLAAFALHELEPGQTSAQTRKNIVRAVEQVAERLGNTPSICRKCYVHPEVLNAYLDGSLIETLRQRARNADVVAGLDAQEQAVLRFLQQRLTVKG